MRVKGSWANNLPRFDDDKTHGVILHKPGETSTEAPPKHVWKRKFLLSSIQKLNYAYLICIK